MIVHVSTQSNVRLAANVLNHFIHQRTLLIFGLHVVFAERRLSDRTSVDQNIGVDRSIQDVVKPVSQLSSSLIWDRR